MMLDLFHRTGSAIPLWLVVFCGLLLSGCGSSEPDYPSTSLQGTVSVDGVPISEGKITFAPTTNGQGKGISGPIKDGRYQLENVPLGNVLVILSAERATGRMKMSSYGGEVPEIESLIPSRYTGGIPLKITSELAEHNFELEKRERFSASRKRGR